MFKRIYIPFDNSEHSQRALALGIDLAARHEAVLVGSHVYAAKLHDWRFRALESGLPEEFQKEKKLERQRVVHDSLITSGLELITDSYLKVMARDCAAADVPFEGVSLEGRNWQALVRDIDQAGYDLVVMGALGLGRTESSLVGTVCERVARRAGADLWVVRGLEAAPPEAPVVVGLDGSERAWGGFRLGLELARSSGRPLIAVSAFDPYFHYTLFDALKSALTSEAQEVFKFEQQERLHEEIIDSGLAKIYQSHLEVAAKLAEDEGVPLETHLLDGKAAEKLLEFARQRNPAVMIVGRTGIHGGKEIDLGGVTEQLLRLAPCDLLLVHREERAPDAYVAEAGIVWSEEGRARLDKAPPQVRGVAMAAIQRFAIAEGFTMITSSVVDQALEGILPEKARISMGITPVTRQGEQPTQGEASGEGLHLSYVCPECNYIHRIRRPETCPVCGERGAKFRVVSGRGRAPSEDMVEMETFDGVKLGWAPQSLARLEAISDFFLRKRARHKVEKIARSRGLSRVDPALVEEALGSGVEPSENAPVAALAEEAGPGSETEAAPPPAPGWSADGWGRLLRAPEGPMRDGARTCIEAHARDIGAETITLDVAEAGMAHAREKMAAEMEARPDQSRSEV